MKSHHIHNPVDLTVLGVDLIAHIESHVAEVTDDASHLFQILIHFILSCIIRYPENTKKHSQKWFIKALLTQPSHEVCLD